MITCECEGLKLVHEIIDLYAKTQERQFTKNDEQRAKEVCEKVLDIISENDVNIKGETPGLWRHFVKQAQEELSRCQKGIDDKPSPCLMALENTRAALHGDWGIRQKIACGPKFVAGNQLESAEKIMIAMYQMRGYGTAEMALKTIEKQLEKIKCLDKELEGK